MLFRTVSLLQKSFNPGLFVLWGLGNKSFTYLDTQEEISQVKKMPKSGPRIRFSMGHYQNVVMYPQSLTIRSKLPSILLVINNMTNKHKSLLISQYSLEKINCPTVTNNSKCSKKTSECHIPGKQKRICTQFVFLQ